MNYYYITYLTKHEQRRSTFIESATEQLIPFVLKTKHKEFEAIVEKKIVTQEEYQKHLDSLKPTPIAEEQLKATKVHPHEKDAELTDGNLFLKDGVLGHKYIVGGKTLILKKVGEGSVVVQYTGEVPFVQISRLTQVKKG